MSNSCLGHIFSPYGLIKLYFIQKVLVERYCATALNQGFMSKVKYCATTLNQGLMSKVQVKIYLKISTVFPFHFKLQLLS